MATRQTEFIRKEMVLSTDQEVASGELASGGTWTLFDASTGEGEVSERLERTCSTGDSVTGGTGQRMQSDEFIRAGLDIRGEAGMLIVRCRADVVAVAADREDGMLDSRVTSNISGVSGDRFVVFPVPRRHDIQQLVATCANGETSTLAAPPPPPCRSLATG